jgi:dolichyl-diphosphooligosaccharide--protein glycosyltransferase
VWVALEWGGYTFVLNMVGLHATALVALGQYNSSLHKAYSLFWLVGRALQSFPVQLNLSFFALRPLRSLFSST